MQTEEAVRRPKRQSRSDRTKGTEPAIRVQNLTKSFGPQKAVDDLSFDVGWGKVTGFLGPNGAGKTTTMRAMLGLIEPTSGDATILGRRYAELAEPVRRVGAVLEATSFHPRRTARGHLRILAQAAGLPASRVDDVLRIVGLEDAAGKRVGAFSLGMRQRLALAGALLGGPRILILDEPANGLDPAGIRWLRKSLKTFAERGNAVLVSSHVLSEVAQLADELVVIDHGRLVTQSSVADVIGDQTDLERAFFRLLGRKVKGSESR